MLHQNPLGPDDLSHGIENLMREYEGAKSGSGNNERRNVIKLIQSLHHDRNESKEYNYTATLGACVFGLIKIDGGFGAFTPPKQESFLKHYYDYGSKLTKLLQKYLNIYYSNPLDDQKALVYLTAFYHHVKKSPRHMDGTLANDKESELLIKEIEKYLQILQQQIAKKRPSYNALKESYSEIPDIYKKLGGADATRDKYTQFTKLLDHVLSDRYKNESKEDKEWSYSYAIRYAAMLFVMEEIEGEYHYLPPGGGYLTKGSALYKACKQALNINYSTKEISDNFKRKCYFHLLAYVSDLREREIEKWEKLGFKDAKKFFEYLQNALAVRVADLITKTRPGAISLSYLDIVTSTAASYGVTIALGKVASEVSLSGAALKYFNLLKPEAALLITLLAFAMKSVVAQKATSAVNTVIINTISQPVIITFSSAKKMGQFCYSLFASERGPHSMEVTDDEDFMAALTSLPKELMSPEVAEKLKYAVGYGRTVEIAKEEHVPTLPIKMM